MVNRFIIYTVKTIFLFSPTFDYMSLSLHEASPGHHLQVSYCGKDVLIACEKHWTKNQNFHSAKAFKIFHLQKGQKLPEKH